VLLDIVLVSRFSIPAASRGGLSSGFLVVSRGLHVGLSHESLHFL
jgi:hypothetical protein